MLNGFFAKQKKKKRKKLSEEKKFSFRTEPKTIESNKLLVV
jgi:hypothetical protein